MTRHIIKLVKDNLNTWRGLGIGAAVLATIITTFVLTHPNLPVSPIEKSVVAISGRELTILDQSKKEIRKLVNDDKLIVAMAGVSVSLMKNKRSIIFLYTDNQDFQDIWDEYLTRRTSSPDLFMPSSPVQNERIASVLNGSFNCSQFTSNIAFQLFPKANDITPWICSISVPPGFDSSDFIGFLNFYLAKEPTEIEKRSLATRAAQLSKDIYRRDVETSPAK